MLLHPLVLRLLRVSLPTNLQHIVLNTVLALLLIYRQLIVQASPLALMPLLAPMIRQITARNTVRQLQKVLMSLVFTRLLIAHPPPNPLTSQQPIALNTAQAHLLLSLLAIAPA